MKHTLVVLIFSLLLGGLLQGCGAILVGGTVAGASVIHDRRSSGTVLDDKAIQFKIFSAVEGDSELAQHSRLSVTSYNYVVLLTGQAETAAYRDRYVEMARNTPMVKRVVDEVQIAPPASFSQESNDAYITTKIKLKLFDIEIPSFDPSRVKVVTEQGVVYLLGLVTAQEADAIVETARYVSGVKRVVKIFEYI